MAPSTSAMMARMQSIAFAVRSKWPEWTRAQVNEHVEKYVALVGLALTRRRAA